VTNAISFDIPNPEVPRRAIAYRGMTLAEQLDERRNPPAFAALLRLSDVASEDIDWLWERWIPAGMLTILGGHGGDGKSTVMASIIAALTTGASLPDAAPTRPTNVLLLSAEDDVANAIRPRLDLHGADPSRVFALQGTIREDGRARWCDLQRDATIIQTAIEQHGIGLVVIDPLSSYLPKSDRNSEGEIRDALRPLLLLMEDTGVGVVGIMHVGKTGDARRASQRLLGSTAFTALARSVLMIADQPDERQPEDIAANGKLKVLQVVKSNYSIPPPPLGFRRPLDAAIDWLGPADVTVEECFAVPARERGRTATERNDAAEFLTELLAAGPVPSSDILAQARTQGFSERTLRRAKKLLAITAAKVDGGGWTWSLPDCDGDDAGSTSRVDRPAS
jgi:RecA-family ATPase